MMIVVVAEAVETAEVRRIFDYARIDVATRFADAVTLLDNYPRPVLIITPDAIGRESSGSGLDLARMARSRGVPCVLVSDAGGEMYGAAGMVPGGDLLVAVRRALALR